MLFGYHVLISVCACVCVLCLGVLCGHGVEPKTSVCTEKGRY